MSAACSRNNYRLVPNGTAAPDTFTRQRELAHFYLEQRDYPRAAIFAYETFLTGLVDKGKGEREFDYDDREWAEKAFLAGKRGNPALKDNYLLLEKLRNALAHGSPPKDKRVKAVLKDEQRLRQELENLIKRLLG